MSMTPVPISIRFVFTPLAPRGGKGEASWRTKWWTRTNAPSIQISSAAIASSTVWRSASAPVRGDPPPGCQAPNERSRSSWESSSPVRTSSLAQLFGTAPGGSLPGEVGADELDGHCAFADRGGAALGRSRADVAGREHAGDVGLQQVVRPGGGAGQDE